MLTRQIKLGDVGLVEYFKQSGSVCLKDFSVKDLVVLEQRYKKEPFVSPDMIDFFEICIKKKYNYEECVYIFDLEL